MKASYCRCGLGNSHCPTARKKEIPKMKHNRHSIWFSLVVFIVLLGMANGVNAQKITRGFLSKENVERGAHGIPHNPNMVYRCTGEVFRVEDVAFVGVKTTSFNWSGTGGGGVGGRFDKTPVLNTKIELEDGTCLNAHLSAIVGNSQTYGASMSKL